MDKQARFDELISEIGREYASLRGMMARGATYAFLDNAGYRDNLRQLECEAGRLQMDIFKARLKKTQDGISCG
jgi:hypothetical protein